MAKNLLKLQIPDSETSSTQSFEISKKDSIRYSTIEYRGETVEFILDPAGHQVFANWRNNKIDLGLDNIYYKEDICKLIDYNLDLITDFPKLPEFQGAQLMYFNNSGYRDGILKYQGRIIKVFLDVTNITNIINESEDILKNLTISKNYKEFI